MENLFIIGPNKQMITLTVIPLSSAHSIAIDLFACLVKIFAYLN
jgi:hypothetical protein